MVLICEDYLAEQSVCIINLFWPSSLFSAKIQNPIEIFHRFFVEGNSDANFWLSLHKYSLPKVLNIKVLPF